MICVVMFEFDVLWCEVYVLLFVLYLVVGYVIGCDR